MADTIDVIQREGNRSIVEVSWKIKSVQTKSSDWIGLFKVGDPDEKYMKCQYTYGAKYGTIIFDLLPYLKRTSRFDVRLFSGKNKLVTSVPLTVPLMDEDVLHRDLDDQSGLAIIAAEASQASYEELKDFDYVLFDHEYPKKIHKGIRVLVPKKPTAIPLIIFSLRGSCTLEDASHNTLLAANWFITDGKESKLRQRVESASDLLLHILRKLKRVLGDDFVVLLTGHSLGGFMAQILYALHQKEFPQLAAHTQNAPPAKDIFVKWYSHLDFDESNCFNHRMTSDLVSMKGGHIGKVISYASAAAGLRALFKTGSFLAEWSKGKDPSLGEVVQAWQGTHSIAQLIDHMKNLKP